MLEIATTLLNTALLIGIFLYQKNKNKVLTDRINEQSNLLKETKDVVTQQAQAIDSQKKVVDTALEYSNFFNIEKIESIVKREADIEYKKLLGKKEEKILSQEKKVKAIVDVTGSTIDKIFKEYVTPLNSELFGLLIHLTQKDREKILENIPKNMASMMREGLKEFDSRKPTGMLGQSIANNIKSADI